MSFVVVGTKVLPRPLREAVEKHLTPRADQTFDFEVMVEREADHDEWMLSLNTGGYQEAVQVIGVFPHSIDYEAASVLRRGLTSWEDGLPFEVAIRAWDQTHGLSSEYVLGMVRNAEIAVQLAKQTVVWLQAEYDRQEKLLEGHGNEA